MSEHLKEKLCKRQQDALDNSAWMLYLPYGSFHKSRLPYKETLLRHPSESINTLSNVIL